MNEGEQFVRAENGRAGWKLAADSGRKDSAIEVEDSSMTREDASHTSEESQNNDEQTPTVSNGDKETVASAEEGPSGTTTPSPGSVQDSTPAPSEVAEQEEQTAVTEEPEIGDDDTELAGGVSEEEAMPESGETIEEEAVQTADEPEDA